jgi:hypothetical protein
MTRSTSSPSPPTPWTWCVGKCGTSCVAATCGGPTPWRRPCEGGPRAVFAGDLEEAEVAYLLDRFCSRASRSGLKPFLTLAQTIRQAPGRDLGCGSTPREQRPARSAQPPVRMIVNRAYGFHSSRAALALIMLTVSPITRVLPHERDSRRMSHIRAGSP